MKGFIVYSDNITNNNETQIQLFGRLENEQSFVIQQKIILCLFIREKDLRKGEKLLGKYKTEKSQLTNFAGEKVLKITAQNQQEINKLTHALHHANIDTYEADIKPYHRFSIDAGILGSIDIEGEYDSSDRIDRVYRQPEIIPAEISPKLKIVSLDTESDKQTGSLFCIGLYTEGYQKNFMITNKKIDDVMPCKSESECLQKFKEELIKLDPDIITGWNLINFDLQYLQELFRKNKIIFDIGRSNEPVSLRIESGFFRQSSADIPGRQVLDALSLIRDPFIREAPSIKNADFESFTLENVAQKILGSGKLIKGKNRHEEIEKLYSSGQHEKLAAYNLTDCKLVYDILAKTKIIELAIERSQLTGMPLDKITSSIASFDSLYIREARKRGFVSPTTRYNQKETRIKGGYVHASKPGIYHNVLVLDFKSLYPSIIRTFNIDPASQIEKKDENAIETPNKAYFKNQAGILPEIITHLHYAREKAKKDGRELANFAIKIIMNSFFGVLASPNCRYFNLDMANAITHFGQMIIKLTAEQIEKKGYKIIYMDTDSVFVETNLGKEKANTLGKEIQEHITSFYKEYVRNKYHRESFLELEFEKQYLSLMIPKIRGAEEETAAKKRYAGLLEIGGKEELEIVGLEAIRGDWTDAAGEFQKELLVKIFHHEPIEAFIKSYIKKIKTGALNAQLIYKKSIRKELDEYTKTTPPHVKAARQLDKLESNIIQYYVTLNGPEPVQKLKHKIDYEHYIDKQITPIANQILILLGKNLDEILKNSKQKKLF